MKRKVLCLVLAMLTLLGTCIGCASGNQPGQETYERIGLMYTFQAAVDSKTSSFASSYNKQVRKATRELAKIADEYSDLE